MKVLEILDFARDNLLGSTSELGAGNCVVTATPALMSQINRLYVQLYYNGSNFSFYGGGLLYRNMSIGLRIYNILALDSVSRYEAESRTMLEFARKTMVVMHMLYDNHKIPLHEPVRIESESTLRRVTENPAAWYMDQMYGLVHAATFEEVKD